MNSPPPCDMSEFDVDQFFKDAYTDITKDIDKVMDIVIGRFNYCPRYYLATVLRSNWYPATQLLTYRLNAYISKTYNTHKVQINGFISGAHLCRDQIHLNAHGYSMFVDKGLGPLLDAHYNILRKPRCERNAPVLSKSAKRRRRNAQKKVLKDAE